MIIVSNWRQKLPTTRERIHRIWNIVSRKCSINNKMIEQTSLTEEETPTCAITQTIERNARHNFVSI